MARTDLNSASNGNQQGRNPRFFEKPLVRHGNAAERAGATEIKGGIGLTDKQTIVLDIHKIMDQLGVDRMHLVSILNGHEPAQPACLVKENNESVYQLR